MSEVEASPPPDEAAAEPPARLTAAEAIEAWDQAIRQVALLLRKPAPEAAWLAQMHTCADRVRALTRRDNDKAIYLLLQAASDDLDRYSAHHAILCAVVVESCARSLAWPDDEVDVVCNAALTMNLSMCHLQDTLTRQTEPLSAEQREQVTDHAVQSAERLAEVGADARWIETVRTHHDAPSGEAGRLARLLMRVDVYAAKLSRRATREPMPAALAARDACLGDQNEPDATGTAILRTMGLYPPGSFVELQSGEVGVVVRRGPKVHQPQVAALRRDDGTMHQQPVLRNGGLARYAVLRGVTRSDVKMQVDHLRVLRL